MTIYFPQLLKKIVYIFSGPTSIQLLKIRNNKSRVKWDTCSKLIIEAPDIVLVSVWLNLNRFDIVLVSSLADFENVNAICDTIALIKIYLCISDLWAVIFKACVHHFFQIFIFQEMIALQKLWKIFFIHLKGSFRSWDIQIFVFLSSPLFFPLSHCFRGSSKKNLCLWHHQLSKY